MGGTRRSSCQQYAMEIKFRWVSKLLSLHCRQFPPISIVQPYEFPSYWLLRISVMFVIFFFLIWGMSDAISNRLHAPNGKLSYYFYFGISGMIHLKLPFGIMLLNLMMLFYFVFLSDNMLKWYQAILSQELPNVEILRCWY